MICAGTLTGLGGLAIGQFLKSIVAHTPLRITPQALFWSTVILTVSFALAGMAVEAVRQLQESNPDPEYHRQVSRGRRPSPPP